MDQQKDATMDSDLDTEYKPCKTCRTNLILSTLVFKNCLDCRLKNRLKEAKRAERKRQQQRSSFTATLAGISDDDGGYTMPEVDAVSSDGGSSTGTMKPAKLLNELEGKDRKAAIREIKVLLQKKIQENGGMPRTSGQQALRNADGRVSAREFQTASAMYEKLKNKAVRSSEAGRRFDFYGYHSIVAVTSINNQQRVAMVAKDLRIPFSTQMRSERTTDYSLYATYYQCDCSSRFFASSKKGKFELQTQAESPCQGLIKVTAEMDDSHPSGIEGQRISVRISHETD